MRRLLIGILITVFSLQSLAQLKDITGKQYTIANLKNGKGSVLVFLAPDCPICQKYTLAINQLQQAFSAQGVNFYGIIPGTNFSNDTIAYFAKNYNLNMPLLVDPDYFLTKSIGATVTPQVVVLNPSAVVLYTGKVDNWYESIGTRRTVITQFYLKDALNSMLAGVPVKVKRTTPVGCFIF